MGKNTTLAGVATENANYRFMPMAHIGKNRGLLRDLAGSDCVVLETGTSSYKEMPLQLHSSYEMINQHIGSTPADKLPLFFFVDIPTKSSIPRAVAFLADISPFTVPALGLFAASTQSALQNSSIILPSAVIIGLAASMILPGALSWSRTTTGVASISGAVNSWHPATGFRDAVSAEKLESAVAPRMAEELGRKPDILLVYGSGHVGILQHLKHKGLRRATIAFHSSLPFVFSERDYMDKVGELSYRTPVPIGDETYSRSEYSAINTVYRIPEERSRALVRK